MPYRVLTAEQVADYLHVKVEDVEALVHQREIPFERQGRRVVFRRQEVDAWASRRILGLSGKKLEHYHQGSTRRVGANLEAAAAVIGELLPVRFIQPALPAKTRAAVIRDVAALAGETGLVTAAGELADSLREREDLFSTAMPGGFALLHPRQHDPYMFERSFVMLARTPRPVPFGAPDGGETRLFFLICCQEDRLHLHVLARLSMMCAQTELLDYLRAASTAAEMGEALADAEALVLRTVRE
jgi:excisionase family DNA binding protein